MARLRRFRFSGGLGVTAAIVVMLVIMPVGVTLWQAFSGGLHTALEVLEQNGLGTLSLHTLAVALAVTPICGVLGVATAFLVERTRLPGRKFWALASVAPLAVPAFVTSYAWVTLSSAMSGYAGAVVITSATYYPIVFLLCAAALRGMDPAPEECARSLGCGPFRMFARVVMPQLRPALLGGMLLVALDSLVEFDAFAALKFQTFSTNVYAQYQVSFNSSGAAVLATVSIVFCVLLLAGEKLLRGKAGYTRVSQGASRAVARYGLGKMAVPVLAGFGLLVLATVGVPIGMLVRWFTEGSSQAISVAAAGTHDLLPATATSVGLGAGAAVLGMALALPVALLATRRQGRLATLIERGSYLSYALPDLVGAIALAWVASHYVPSLYESVPLLVFAYAILFVPFGVVSLRATFAQVEPAVEECARSLGLSGFRTFWRVTLPISRPGMGAAGVLVFAFAVGDLSTTLVLLPPGMHTLSTQFWSNSSTVAFAAAAPYAAVLVGIALVATYVLMSRFGKVRMLSAR